MNNETMVRREAADEDGDRVRNFHEAMELVIRARAFLELRHSMGKNIRAAIRCLLQAQEVLDSEGLTAEIPLELVSASLWTEAAEQGVRSWTDEEQMGKPGAKRERRAYPRVPITLPIQLEPDLLLTAETGFHLPIEGETVNVSRGGLLARVDHGILESGRYRVHFLGNGSPVLWGTVRRARAVDDTWEAGIEFAAPLADLKDFRAHEPLV